MFNIFKRKIEIAKPLEEWEERRAELKVNKRGEKEMHIEGEKYPLRGCPKEGVIMGKLDRIKDLVKESIRLAAIAEKEVTPQENMKLPVRALAEVFDELIEAENVEGMRDKWRWMKKIACSILEMDDAYCFRFQTVMERLCKRIKDIKLSKADKYYFYSRKDFNWEFFEYGKKHE